MSLLALTVIYAQRQEGIIHDTNMEGEEYIMSGPMYITYGAISLVIAIAASFHAVAQLRQNYGQQIPESRWLRAIVVFALAGLILLAFSSIFDYFVLYMYMREKSMRISPQMSSQIITWQFVRIIIITLAYIVVLVNGWSHGIKRGIVETLWDKVTWGLFLLGIGRMAADPLLLVVQIVQHLLQSGKG